MKVIVENKYSRIIHGGKDNLIDIDVYKELKKLLSVYSDGYEHSKKYKTKDILCKNCNYQVTTDEAYWKCIQCGKDDFIINRHWDGKIHYIDKKLRFLTGFLEPVVEYLESLGFEITLVENRKNKIQPPSEVVKKLPVWSLREFMIEDLERILLLPNSNFIQDSDSDFLYFPRGIYEAATNAGKNSFIAAAYFTLDCKTLITVHRRELFNQAYKFFTQCGIKVSRFGQGHEELGNFTVAMVRTLKNRSKELNVKNYLASVHCLIVDECHRAGANEYKSVIRQTDAFARLFLSGTPLPEIDQNQMDIIGQSGPIFAQRTNDFLIEKGFSQRPKVFMYKYSFELKEKERYKDEVARMKFNQNKMDLIKNLCIENIDSKILIVVEHKDHGRFIFENLLGVPAIVEFVHGQDKERDEKVKRFTDGDSNILISTMIMKEGVNISDINMAINAFGGKSLISLKQVIGRLIRHDGINNTCTWVDFIDEGKNLTKHTEYRVNLYQKEKFEIFYK